MAVRSHNHRWDTRAQSWRCQMAKEVIVALFFIGALLGFFFWHRVKQFCRWLKGSRKNYYLADGSVRELELGASYRGAVFTPIIEIRKILWWYQGEVHGTFGRWQITKVGRHGFGYDVWLGWERREDLGSALRLMNAYSRPLALHEMLNRIAKLEKELEVANNRRQEFRAAIKALINRMELDRQHYRSKAAADVRICLEDIDRWATDIGERQPERSITGTWP
ncbi:MAG: hypothetical protein HY454_01970, partial [Parcubacteria group bacterium]|nr:hypothetical protein [Parcubacteria group bacterium]